MLPASLEFLITYNPRRLAAEDNLLDATAVLEQSPGQWAPVTTATGDILGGLTLQGVLECTAQPDWRNLTVQQYMTRTPSVDCSAAPQLAGRGLMMNRLTPLPVLDRSAANPQEVIGVLTVYDFLREAALSTAQSALQPVTSIVQPVNEPLDAKLGLADAEAAIAESESKYFAVQHAGLSLGIVSRSQIQNAARRQLCGLTRQLQPVSSLAMLVNRQALVKPGDHIAHGAALCAEHETLAVAVVNHAQRLEGVLPARSILEHALANSVAV